MWYSIIIITLITLFYFKKKSKSQFFKQDDYALEMFREKMVILLQIKDRTPAEISNYCAAYDFFCKFTTKFDGATFVKDLYDLPKLDLDLNSPIVVQPGEFVQLVAKNLKAVTTTKTITFLVGFEKY